MLRPDDGPAGVDPREGVGVLERAAMLGGRLARDAAAVPLWRRTLTATIAPQALDAAIEWLVSTHNITGRRGCSKGVNLLRGWMPAFPETTGYIIGTLLTEARRSDRRDLAEHAVEMGDWELEVQGADGGVMAGLIDDGHGPVAFNTGMVLHGYLDLWQEVGDDRYLEGAVRAGEFLISHQSDDGAWRGPIAYRSIATTYHSRVAWALARLGMATDSQDALDAAVRHLDWCLGQQDTTGWFASCAFRRGGLPNTHSIAYTLRGLLEGGLLLGEQRYIDAVTLASEHLIRKLEVLGTLPASLDRDWAPASRYVCLTGLVQLGDVWLKLATTNSDDRFLNAGLKAISQAASRQELRPGPAHGALPGSFPILGRYAPLQYPNWATKFLTDALISVEEVGALLEADV
jgi:hypothetical protein